MLERRAAPAAGVAALLCMNTSQTYQRDYYVGSLQIFVQSELGSNKLFCYGATGL